MKTGKTTRLVNRYVEELFKNGVTHVYEGRNTPNETALTKECFRVFENRMQLEHEDTFYKKEFVCISGINCYKVTLI